MIWETCKFDGWYCIFDLSITLLIYCCQYIFACEPVKANFCLTFLSCNEINRSLCHVSQPFTELTSFDRVFFVTFLFFFQLSVRHNWIKYIHAMQVALMFPNSCASAAICCFPDFFVLFWLIWGSMEHSGAAKKTWWDHIYLEKNTVNSSRVAFP